MMLSEESYIRVDTLKMRALIIRKIGHQRAEKYFDNLRKLLSLKISKCDFDKFCTQVMGKENIPLHNHLIRSIVKNAYLGKVPPSNGCRRVSNILDSRASNQNSIKSVRGHIHPLSPHRSRFSANRDRSLLHSLRKREGVPLNEVVSRIQEQQSATELHSLGSRPPASVEDGEEVEQVASSPGVQSRTPVTAPLGLSVQSFEASRDFHFHNNAIRTCQSTGELPSTRLLRSCWEKKLKKDCLGISLDCVNMLNISLDAYLKRLIKQCVDIAGSRSCYSEQKQGNGQFIPGLGRDLSESGMQSPAVNTTILDFQAAMELTPNILGPDWAKQLEKISLASEE